MPGRGPAGSAPSQAPHPTPLTCLVAGFILADLMIKPGSRVYNLNVLKIALSLFSF